MKSAKKTLRPTHTANVKEKRKDTPRAASSATRKTLSAIARVRLLNARARIAASSFLNVSLFVFAFCIVITARLPFADAPAPLHHQFSKNKKSRQPFTEKIILRFILSSKNPI